MKKVIRSIQSIYVKKLFGTFDYTLEPNNERSTVDKLMILYGDNGSGKTTILNCIFHLLAPNHNQGHKGLVASIPFKRFEINFSTGEKVCAERKGSNIIGSFTMSLHIKGKESQSINFIADSDLIVTAESQEQSAKIDIFLNSLSELDLSLFLLSDDRTVRFAGGLINSANLETERRVNEEMVFHNTLPQLLKHGRRHLRDSVSPGQILLVESLNRAQSWIQTQVLRGSSFGESSVNSLYSEILKRLSRLRKGESLQPDADKRSIENRVKQLETRSGEYAKYGLMPEFNGKLIVSALSDLMDSNNMSIVSNVLTPYFDSIEKKLEALGRIYNEVNAFVNVINSFFRHKSIRYDMHKGFEIISDSEKVLQPQVLSSGERHLLLLFLNTITAFERPSLFIIDEPEISLNIKWQRKLLSSLLECVGDNPVQYIFATHSIELLTQHKNNVLKLD